MGEYNIGQFIYHSRKAIGLTQEELCHDENGFLCFSVETLSRIERGKQRPNYRTMREIMKRLGKENCFCTPYLKTTDYRMLELERELKRVVTLNDYDEAERMLEQLENGLSLEYMTNRQFLIYMHALIDHKLGRITVEEELELLEKALQMTVHSYGTRRFSFEILLPEEIVIVCNIAFCHGEMGNINKALELLEMLMKMLDDQTRQINYPSGVYEMVNRNRIKWLGEQGRYGEAIHECDKAIAKCIKKNVLFTLPSLYYARAYNMQELKESIPPHLRSGGNEIEFNYIECALLAELVQDSRGRDKALAKLTKSGFHIS